MWSITCTRTRSTCTTRWPAWPGQIGHAPGRDTRRAHRAEAVSKDVFCMRQNDVCLRGTYSDDVRCAIQRYISVLSPTGIWAHEFVTHPPGAV